MADWAAIGVIAMLVINVLGMVWGASHINTTVKHLDQMVGELKGAMNNLSEAVNKLHTRVTVLERQRRE